MSVYKLYKTTGSDIPNAAYIVNEDGSTTSFIFDQANSDFVEYNKWLSLGNQPLPPDAE